MTDQEFPKLDWQTLRQIARQVGISWVDAMLRDFKEPERTGAHKGDPIGLSLSKRKAALLMILHPRALQLRDVAKLAGTTDGTVRFWRCQNDFREAEGEGYIAFGEHLCNTLERGVEGNDARPYLEVQGIPLLEKRPVDLIYLIPFFNPEVVFLIEELVRSKFHSGKRAYSILALGFLKMVYSHLGTVDDSQKVKTLRKWMRDPDVQSLTKIALTELIDSLADPDRRKKDSEEQIKLCADILKDTVFSFLWIL